MISSEGEGVELCSAVVVGDSVETWLAGLTEVRVVAPGRWVAHGRLLAGCNRSSYTNFNIANNTNLDERVWMCVLAGCLDLSRVLLGI